MSKAADARWLAISSSQLSPPFTLLLLFQSFQSYPWIDHIV